MASTATIANPNASAAAKPDKSTGGEREPEHEQRHHEQRRRPPARFTECGSGLMQQIQHERRGDQQQRKNAQPDHVTEIGIPAGEFCQQHRQRYHRTDAGDHRCRTFDQRPRADAPGQHQRAARDARTIRAPAACPTRATLCVIATAVDGHRADTAARYRLRAVNVSRRSSRRGSKNRVRYSASLTVRALMYINVSAPRKNVI
jgi:hypothetical protein